ncbi:hypothetical protein [Methylobacterium sp. CM6257]
MGFLIVFLGAGIGGACRHGIILAITALFAALMPMRLLLNGGAA